MQFQYRTNYSSTWRLIPPIVGTGKMQMAIDEWLLEQHLGGKIPSTLRFYTWLPIAISIGYHQRNYPSSWDSLIWEGEPIELVKRPTGGRGVLHQGDLTYAVITSGLDGNRSAIYQQICQFLIAGWRELEVDLTYGETGRGYIHNPNCFGTATAADLVCANGYKLIGSAQLIRSGAILQHGSMRLNPDRVLYDRVFGTDILTPPDPITQLSILTITETLIAALKNCFGIDLEIEPLTDREWAQISQRL
jgi:lipoate---protein ligase